jgi:5-methylcytosine-specific restriction endonuclease McrA
MEENREAINARARARRAPRHRNWSRRQVWEIAVNLLAARDGQHCWLCTLPWTWETVSIDHVIPVYAGGKHDADNIRLAHRTCNMRRQRVGLVAWNRDLSVG